MSDPVISADVAEWVRRAGADPNANQQRQTVEISLHAIAMTAPLETKMFLKGGILEGLAYDSPRQTRDIDSTTALAPIRQDRRQAPTMRWTECSHGLPPRSDILTSLSGPNR
ncbi:MAG: hypothetical protein OXN89_16840 [Bryobacterales bacterium]|nr:hypothetical protein [Bryobacterales bacterium]